MAGRVFEKPLKTEILHSFATANIPRHLLGQFGPFIVFFFSKNLFFFILVAFPENSCHSSCEYLKAHSKGRGKFNPVHQRFFFFHSGLCEISLFTEVLSPFGVNEGDVVLFCPACKHVFLRNKAVVVPSSAALVLYVRYTFIGPPGLVVVVGHLSGSIFLSRKTKVLMLLSCLLMGF